MSRSHPRRAGSARARAPSCSAQLGRRRLELRVELVVDVAQRLIFASDCASCASGSSLLRSALSARAAAASASPRAPSPRPPSPRAPPPRPRASPTSRRARPRPPRARWSSRPLRRLGDLAARRVDEVARLPAWPRRARAFTSSRSRATASSCLRCSSPSCCACGGSRPRPRAAAAPPRAASAAARLRFGLEPLGRRRARGDLLARLLLGRGAAAVAGARPRRPRGVGFRSEPLGRG